MKIGHRWRFVSQEEAWHILAPYLTSTDAAQFEELAVDILSRKSPAFDLPVSERWLANDKGKVLPHSETLLDGITRGLALIGTQPERMKNVQTASYIPGSVVFRVLGDDSDWRTWATLGEDLLSTISEAAPDAFLDTIESALNASPATFKTLFAQEGDPPFSGAPHTGLLRGLERLAWSKDHFSRVVVLLARLAELDPGGQVANRPSASLTELFCFWTSFTEATDKHRLETLSMLVGRYPTIGWATLVNAYPLPVHNGVVLRNPPLWQPWGQDGHSTASISMSQQFIVEMTRLLMENVGDSAARWKDLVGILTAMPREARENALTLLAQQAEILKQDAEAESLRAAIRLALYRHRSHPDAKWAMPSEDVEALDYAYRKLEPSDPVLAHAWLFDSGRIDMPDGEQVSYLENRERGAVARQDAVRTIFANGGVDAILSLIDTANAPHRIGIAVANSIEADEAFPLALDCIKSKSQKRQEFAIQFFNAHCRQSGWAVLDRALNDVKSVEGFNPKVVSAIYLLASPVDLKTCLQRIEAESESVQDAYWRSVNRLDFVQVDVDEEIFDYSVQRLLTVGRSLSVAQLVWRRKVSAELLIRTLEQIPIDWSNGTDTIDNDPSYICTELFNRLDKFENVSDEAIARLEIPFIGMIGQHRPNLALHIIGMIGQHRPNLALHKEALREPSLFADLIAMVSKRADGTDENVADDRTSEAQVSFSYKVLSSLRGLPGQMEDGTIDLEALTAWVLEVRRFCEERDCKDVGDQQIGEVLANAPVGDDGVCPCEPVRDLLDDLPMATHIGRSFVVGKINLRSMTTRGLYDDGAQEHSLAEKYRMDAAKIAAKWPFTAKLLREIANDYDSDAHFHDVRSAWTEATVF